MELTKIKTQTTWGEAVNEINANHQKIAIALRNVSEKNRGYFTTYDKLIAAVPNPNIGDVAFVGYAYPFTIYEWDGSVWIYAGTGGAEVNLNDYVRNDSDNDIVGSLTLTGKVTAHDGFMVTDYPDNDHIIISGGDVKAISDFVQSEGDGEIDGNFTIKQSLSVGAGEMQVTIDEGKITAPEGVVIKNATELSAVMSDGTIKPITEFGTVQTIETTDQTEYEEIF